MPTISENLPSEEVVAQIEQLKVVNCSPSAFFGMAPEDIAQTIFNEYEGKITLDVSKTPEPEIRNIKAAGEVPVNGKTPTITILGEGEENSEEDRILRTINEEILSDENEVNIGRTAFREFIKTLLEDEENYELVRDEWNKFIVEHAVAGNATNPCETHHFANVGLLTRSQGEDALREQVIGFIKGIMEEFRPRIKKIFENEDIYDHEHPEMNNPDSLMFALGMAEWSNFVRGAVYHRIRRGEGSLDGYQPRRVASDTIDRVKAEQSK